MTKLAILTPKEQRNFDLPPKFKKAVRSKYFSISPKIKQLAFNKLRSPVNRVGFILQLGYFRASGKFFVSEEFKKSNTTVMGYVSINYKIEIRAPQGSNLDIKGDDDDYFLTAIHGEISINADDADVILKNCRGNRFFFDLDDGDITMDRGQGQLTARMDDGDIEISNAAFQNIDYRGDDGDFAIETSISPNAMFKFSGDDSTFDIVVTQGGGTFTINHDDGNIDYDDNFRLMDKSGDRTVLSLTGGRGKIIISGDDIRVNLAATHSN